MSTVKADEKRAEAATVKVRKLVFDRAQDGPEKFEVIFDALAAVFHRHAQGFSKLETANAVLRRLNAISKLAPQEGCPRCGRPANEYQRVLDLDDEYVVLLPGVEYRWLKELVEDETIGWLFHRGIAAEAAIHWLRDCPEVEVGEAEIQA